MKSTGDAVREAAARLQYFEYLPGYYSQGDALRVEIEFDSEADLRSAVVRMGLLPTEGSIAGCYSLETPEGGRLFDLEADVEGTTLTLTMTASERNDYLELRDVRHAEAVEARLRLAGLPPRRPLTP